jgi:hypothetical protein
MARIHPTFWVGGRFDQVKLTTDSTRSQTAENMIIAYVPTEFSALRLQSGLTQESGQGTQWQALLQLNVTIGSHPAHAY